MTALTPPFATATQINLAQATITDELRVAVDTILSQTQHAFRVFYPPHVAPRRTAWAILTRPDVADPGAFNAATLQYDRLEGFSLNFPIRPNRETGSALKVSVPGTEKTHDPGRDPENTVELIDTALAATTSSHKNFATTSALPNHGPAHFNWTNTLVEITKVDA